MFINNFFLKIYFYMEYFYSYLFFFLASIAIISGFLIISCKNPIHAIFSLIVSFTAIVFIMLYFLRCDFLSIIFLIVYVGAVSILFLFIVMLLNIKNIDLVEQYFNYLPVGFFIGLLFLIEMYYFLAQGFKYTPTLLQLPFIFTDYSNHLEHLRDLEVIAIVLYEEFFVLFILASLLLLIAMVGAIILTVRIAIKIKKQYVSKQVFRKIKIKSLLNIQTN